MASWKERAVTGSRLKLNWSALQQKSLTCSSTPSTALRAALRAHLSTQNPTSRQQPTSETRSAPSSAHRRGAGQRGAPLPGRQRAPPACRQSHPAAGGWCADGAVPFARWDVGGPFACTASLLAITPCSRRSVQGWNKRAAPGAPAKGRHSPPACREQPHPVGGSCLQHAPQCRLLLQPPQLPRSIPVTGCLERP